MTIEFERFTAVFKQPLFKAKMVAVILGLLLVASIYAIFVTFTENQKLSNELKTANGEIHSLGQDIKELKDAVAKSKSINDQYTVRDHVDNEKLGAFAKQAAICNTLREKLNIPQ